MDVKRCGSCGETKPVDQFHKRGGTEGGYRSKCKVCLNGSQRQTSRQWKQDNKDRVRAYNRGWMDANKDRFRKSKNDRQKRYEQAHPERVAEAHRVKRERNPELYHLLMQAASLRRRARVAGAYFEDVDRALVWARDAGVCHLCGLPAGDDWQLEHVVPIAAGGAHSYQNTAVSHPACNQSKNNRRVPSLLGMRGAFIVRPVSCL